MVEIQKTKRRWRRVAKKRQQSAIELGQQADKKIDSLLLRRVERLVSVKRFVFLWIALFAILFLVSIMQGRALSTYYQSLQPTPGGLLSEGLTGTFTNANPLYATNTADAAVSRLIFASLFKYDSQNHLVGDLASDIQRQKDQTTYIVHLKDNLVWQDGQPLTADDVVYTYRTIQNDEAQSPLMTSWQGINVSKKDNRTVIFQLPDPLAAFPYSLTNGIVPEHLLKNVEPSQLRTADFNTQPVGSGPFSWKFVEVSGTTAAERQQRISMIANSQYYAGRPKLDGFNITTFSDEKHLLAAFAKKQVYAVSGLDYLPPTLAKEGAIEHQTPYTSAAMAFFNNSNPVLSDVKVRQALTQAVDTSNLVNVTGKATMLAVAPLLQGQLGSDPIRHQLAFSPKKARALLDQAGWKRAKDGLRYKDKQPLAFTLRTQDTKNYAATAQYLQSQWEAIGAKVDIRYYDSNDLQSVIITNHDYDILLYAISIGLDPDVFAYWDSSQASITSQGHLNLSEYKSSQADQALEAGRTRADNNLRRLKYNSFLTAWRNDAPALALYQPNFLYVSRGPIFNYERPSLVSSTDRFNNVENWMIRQTHQTF